MRGMDLRYERAKQRAGMIAFLRSPVADPPQRRRCIQALNMRLLYAVKLVKAVMIRGQDASSGSAPRLKPGRSGSTLGWHGACRERPRVVEVDVEREKYMRIGSICVVAA